jgi:hypothetical protein
MDGFPGAFLSRLAFRPPCDSSDNALVLDGGITSVSVLSFMAFSAPSTRIAKEIIG